jgi:L-2-hydroxyglutarate oxidase
MDSFDLEIVGGGIVGLAAALTVSERFPGLNFAVIEKEREVAFHQTGRNSGVIHAGVYYQPGSLKARLCKEGAEATIRFCRDYGLPFERCGKMLVATDQAEMARMATLFDRCQANGIAVERIDAAELARREPHTAGSALSMYRLAALSIMAPWPGGWLPWSPSAEAPS